MRSNDASPISARRLLLRLSLLLVLAALLLAALGPGAYQRRIEPPVSVADPVSVFVIDYGFHASLVLPNLAMDGAQGTSDPSWVEWSWGDWTWFALERTGIPEGLQALFASPRSTLSRRVLDPAGSPDALAARVGAEHILPVMVERERAAALLLELEARWSRRRGDAVAHASGRIFVPEENGYGLFNNSVHELTRWLEALGAKVSGFGLTADFALREP